ncbi:hypothetical protein Tco_0885468 [Tanacetum coccineum]
MRVVQGYRSGKDLKLVSAIKMRKYLEKDRVTYLAHIVDKGANVKSIQNILIEKNHTEVFPKELSRLPLTRIVKYQIDLVAGAAPSMDENERHLDIILRFIKDKKWYVKFSKCEFLLQEVQFLGHVVDTKGIYVDPEKIEAIRKWGKTTMDLVTKLPRTS